MLEPDVNIRANMPHVMLIRSRGRGRGGETGLGGEARTRYCGQGLVLHSIPHFGMEMQEV